MVAARYNRREWQQLAAVERAEAVAFYRLSLLVELHQNDAVASHAQSLSASHDG